MTTSSSDDTPRSDCLSAEQEKCTDKDTSVALANAQELCQRAQAILSNVPPASNQEQPQEQPMDLFQQALRIRQSILGDSHAVVAETHCLIARAWISQRHYAIGLDHYGLALDILKKKEHSTEESTAKLTRTDVTTTVSSLQKDFSNLLDTAVETANYSMQQGTEAQARQQPAEALEHFEYAQGLLGAVLKHSATGDDEETKLNSLAFCDVCRVIASVHVSHSDYHQALAYLQQAHGVLEPLLGKEDPRSLAMASDVQTVEKLANHKRPDTAQDVLQWFEQEDYHISEREDVVATPNDDNDKPLGVSIDWIKRGFWQELQVANLDPLATIRQVMDGVLIPKQQQLSERKAYAEQLDSQYTGPASLMLSYSNESTIADIVNTLDDYCRTQALDDRTVFVWMECLCQWKEPSTVFPAAEKKEEEKQSTPNDDPPQPLPPEEQEALQTQISHIGHVLAILTPWFHPRLWKEPSSLYEISLAQHTEGCKLTLVLPPAENSAVSDAIIEGPSLPIARLYQALGELPLDQQRIFRPWIRNVLQAQVKEHCNPTEEELAQTGSSRSLLSVTSSVGGETEEQAMDVFKLQLCNKMGLLFWQYGEYKTALELLEDALGMTESVYGETHESTATVYQNIANVLSDMGRYSMALDTYLRALHIMETSSAQQHPRIAALCTKLGNLYRMTDQLDKAMEYHQRALTIQIKLHGSTHNLAAADCYKDMGNVFFSKGDNQAALMEFRKVLGIQQSVWQDKSHPTLAATHNQIGLVLQAKGDYEGALKEYRTAVSIQEAALGMDHVQTAMTYDNIASVLECQDDWEGALEISTKAQAIYQACLGANHPTTAAAWHAMGAIQNELDQVEDSLQSYHKALAIRQSVLGMEHPQTAETLQSIGTILFEIGDLDEALVELKKAFDIVEPLLGIEHPTTKSLADAINAVLEA